MQEINAQIVRRILTVLILSVICFFYQLREINSWKFATDTLFKGIQIPNLNTSISCFSFEKSFLNAVIDSGRKLSKNESFSGTNQPVISSSVKGSKVSSLDVNLYGIILWKNNLYALLKCGSKFFFVKKGDLICDNIKIIDIQSTKVSIKIDGKEKALTIFNKRGIINGI